MWPKFSEIFSSRILDFIKWAHSKILLKFSIKISLRMSGYFFLNSLNHKLYSHAFCAKFLYDALPFTVIVSSVVLGRESFSGNLPKCIYTCILSCRRVNSNEFCTCSARNTGVCDSICPMNFLENTFSIDKWLGMGQ